MAAREVVKVIRMRIPTGQAKPAPPVGTQLGGAGLNIMGFCKDFNARTQDFLDGTPIPVVINGTYVVFVSWSGGIEGRLPYSFPSHLFKRLTHSFVRSFVRDLAAYKDRSFDYTMRTPPVTYFLLKAAGLKKGANQPGHEVAGYLSLKHIYGKY